MMSESDSDDEVQNANVEEAAGLSSSIQKDPPLLKIMKQLIKSSNPEEVTNLTKSQILKCLKKDFNIDTSSAHPLEVGIYLSIMRTYLKKWPRWDVVEKATEIKFKNIKKILDQECQTLKKYLQHKLDVSKEPIAEAVIKARKLDEKRSSQTSDVVLQVICTRDKYNNLYFKYPDQMSTFFNINTKVDTKLTAAVPAADLPLNEIFNWPFVFIHIDLGVFEYTRQTASSLQHTLVNKKLGHAMAPPKTSPNVHYRANTIRTGMKVPKIKLIEYLVQLTKAANKINNFDVFNCIIALIKNDLVHAPDVIDPCMEYKYFCNPHAYVRFHSTEVNNCNGTAQKKGEGIHDLELEEVIIPAVLFNAGKIPIHPGAQNDFPHISKKILKTLRSQVNKKWLKIVCDFCKESFYGFADIERMRQHFKEHHSQESGWSCVSCNKKFTMRYLASHQWTHDCVNVPNGFTTLVMENDVNA